MYNVGDLVWLESDIGQLDRAPKLKMPLEGRWTTNNRETIVSKLTGALPFEHKINCLQYFCFTELMFSKWFLP